MDQPSLAGSCRSLESKLSIKAIDVDKEKTLCKQRDVKISESTVDSLETGSMQFVGRQEGWARLAAYKQVQRRREKNLRLCSYRLRRSVKNDPLPLSVHTGVRSALLKNKEKGIVSSILADKICKVANVSQKSIKLYCQLANLIHPKVESERLKLDANDFIQVFFSYIERTIPTLAVQFRQIYFLCTGVKSTEGNDIDNDSMDSERRNILFVKRSKELFENLILTSQVQIQSNLRNDIFFALEDIHLNISCMTNCANNVMSESYPNYDNMNIGYERCFDPGLQKMWMWQSYQDHFFVRDSNWRKKPYPPRPFEVIDEYIPVIEARKCFEKLNSSKVGLHAPPEGAPGTPGVKLDLNALEKRQPLKLAPAGLEFPNEMTHKYDIVLTNTWGYDSSTYRRLFRSLLVNTVLSVNLAKKFISKTLLPAINRQVDEDAHDIGIALKEIILKANKKGNHVDFTCASTILHEVQKDRLFFNSKNFRIFPKGQGLVCNRREGIAAGTFVERYLGELFSPWRWFEKTDAVKVAQKKLGMKTSLPDFYNIIMERHSDDKKGYNLMFVDPIARGNIASRLSHSCTPNCATIVISENGKYVTTVYAIRDIAYGEELSFDYGSSTEDKNEHEQATCLCGTENCRGAFLQFSNDKVFQEVMLQEHTTLDRTAILVRACSEKLNDEDKDLLTKHKIGPSICDGAPSWLLKWGALILRFLDFEKKQLTYDLVRRYPFYTVETAGDDAAGIYATRLQNLVITMEKLKYCLGQQGQNLQPPLKILSAKEVVKILWNDTDDELGEPIAKTIIKNAMNDMQNIAVRKQLNKLLQTKIEANEKGLKKLKGEIIIEARNLLYTVESTSTKRYTAAADLLTLYAHTQLNFTKVSYTAFTSPPITLRQCDLGDTLRPLKEKDRVVSGKKYNSQYIWGQLHFWERQTIAQPDASLMAARYGPIVLPDAECCFSSHINSYSKAQRNTMIDIFENKPHSQWKTSTHWRFKNKYSIFGSPFLDAAYAKSKNGFDIRLNLALPKPATQPTNSPNSHNVKTSDAVEQDDDLPCNICGLTGDTHENPALLCDTCETGCAHIYCLNMKKVPAGDWHCPACLEKRNLALPKWLREIKSYDRSTIKKSGTCPTKGQYGGKKRSGTNIESVPLKMKASRQTKKQKMAKPSDDDKKPCNICGLTGSTQYNPALLCDGCDYGCAHLQCLNLQRVPRRDWYCDLCKHNKIK